MVDIDCMREFGIHTMVVFSPIPSPSGFCVEILEGSQTVAVFHWEHAPTFPQQYFFTRILSPPEVGLSPGQAILVAPEGGGASSPVSSGRQSFPS